MRHSTRPMVYTHTLVHTLEFYIHRDAITHTHSLPSKNPNSAAQTDKFQSCPNQTWYARYKTKTSTRTQKLDSPQPDLRRSRACAILAVSRQTHTHGVLIAMLNYNLLVYFSNLALQTGPWREDRVQNYLFDSPANADWINKMYKNKNLLWPLNSILD